jgi:hypothetical protein
MRLGVLLVVRLTFQGGCSTSQQQLQFCRRGGKSRANYRGCTKWKEAKVALVKRAHIERNKVSGLPIPTTKLAEPSAEQESLGPGWNHAVRGGRVVKAATPPSPKALLSQSPKPLPGKK